MLFDDYVAASNNSVNDNIANAKKAATGVHQLKKLLKPVLALILNRSRKASSVAKKQQEKYYYEDDQECCCEEQEQNAANEDLEARIFEDVDCCERFAAVPVYDEEGHLDLVPVVRGQRYVPVHFARTEAGTFFWTSTTGPDCDLVFHGDENPITGNQVPELQVASDRWAQA